MSIMKLLQQAQGGLQKQMPDSEIDGMMQGGGASGGGLMGMIGGLLGGNKGGGLAMLSQMLDADGDGSPLDDILGRFLR